MTDLNSSLYSLKISVPNLKTFLFNIGNIKTIFTKDE